VERHVFVSADSLRKALKGWGLTLDEAGVFAFLNRFDLHDDGRIDFTGFSVLLAELLQPGKEAMCVCGSLCAGGYVYRVCVVVCVGA
jgi:hypothetical protein